MHFTCDGRHYDSSELIALKGYDAYELGMFVTRDHQSVFGVVYQPNTGVEVCGVSGPELRVLAERTHDPDLVEAYEEECACTYPGEQ